VLVLGIADDIDAGCVWVGNVMWQIIYILCLDKVEQSLKVVEIGLELTIKY